MTAKELWAKLLSDGTGQLADDGNSLIPKKEYKIKGDVVDKLVKNKSGDIEVILKHITVINHPGENIDYSLYGTPKHSMGD